jgi:hypothetical protein
METVQDYWQEQYLPYIKILKSFLLKFYMMVLLTYISFKKNSKAFQITKDSYGNGSFSKS